MRKGSNITVALIGLACLAALAISVYPGVLNDLLFIAILLSFLVVPLIAVSLLIMLVLLHRRGKLSGLKIPWLQAGVALLMLAGTYVTLKFYVPRRIAFASSRAQFEKLLADAPKSADHGATPLNQRVGLYQVDEYATDPRGGVYFRVYAGADGIGPDTMSYGFAFQPNQEGSPFGASQYRLHRLGSGWYWFRASNDWF